MDMTLFYWIMGLIGAIMMLMLLAIIYFVKRLIDNIDKIDGKVSTFAVSIELQLKENSMFMDKVDELWEEIKNIHGRHAKYDAEIQQIRDAILAMINRHELHHGDKINVFHK